MKPQLHGRIQFQRLFHVRRGLGKCAINVLTVNELEKEDEQNSEELVEKTKRKRIQAQRIRLEEQAKWPLLDQEGKDDEEEFGVSSSEDK